MYKHFKEELERIEGSGKGDHPSHDESQELMYEICSESKWWQWRDGLAGQLEFSSVPLSWKMARAENMSSTPGMISNPDET